MDRLFYINLDERKDRDEHIQEELKKAGIPATITTRVSAVDGTKLPDDIVAKYISNADFKGQPFARRALGCFLTHMFLWQLIDDRKLNCAVVLEDDVSLIPDFKNKLADLLQNLPSNTEIVSIGLPQFEKVLDINNQTDDILDKLFIKRINEYVGVLHPDLNPGALGYIITKKGASSILESFDKSGITCAVDVYISAYLETKNNRYASLKTLLTTTEKLGSDISGVLPIITKT